MEHHLKHHDHLLLFSVAGFLTALLIFIAILYRPTAPYFVSPSIAENVNKTTISNTDVISSLNDKIKSLENKIVILSAKLDSQSVVPSTQPTISSATKSILAVAQTKGSLFTTSAANYTPIGMYVNIKCPKDCYLWINFYSSSQNTGSSPPQQGHVNTYTVFLNETDQGIYSQANIQTSSSSIPVSLNAVIPASAGFYTIDIRAKTSGGTLQSNVSALQVMAIER